MANYLRYNNGYNENLLISFYHRASVQKKTYKIQHKYHIHESQLHN